MIDKIINLDKELFLALNSKHVDWLDPLMLVLSSYIMWTIVFLFFGTLIYVLQKKYKISSVVFYALSVTLTTCFVNGLKVIIQRPRPIHEESWSDIIHSIERHSEAYSFFSSHAATTFCIAMFVYLILPTRRYYGYIAFVWALGVSYSRIYVAKHYPLDVAIGIVFGIFMGYVGYKILVKYVKSKYDDTLLG